MNMSKSKFVMLPLPPFHRYYYFYFLFMLCYLPSLEASTNIVQGCSPAERDALLALKSSFNNPSSLLESWNCQYDCCGWSGVVCRNDTTTTHVHVVELNLANPNYSREWTTQRGKKLSPSLLSLTHLEVLDISWNDFGGAPIPNFIGSFPKLKYLDLGMSNFSGIIPPQLGNLSNLHHLNLQTAWSDPLRVETLDWLKRLSSLTYLDMSGVNLNATSHNWLSTMNMLPSLQVLKLHDCSLDQIPSSLTHLNLTSLVTLDLSINNFNTTLPSWLWQLTALSSLHLSYSFYGIIPAGIRNLRSLTELSLYDCLLSGPIPTTIGNLTSLTILDLGENTLTGPLPMTIGNLTSLRELNLGENALTGPIPTTIGNLTSLRALNLYTNSLTGPIPIEIRNLFNLKTLDLSSNSLEGVISQLHFSNLTNLYYLDLSNNPLLTIDHNWLIPSQLQSLGLNSLKLGPAFPMWLKSHNTITKLSLSNTSIEGNLPSWLWTSVPIIQGIDLSYNKITSTLPSSLESYTYLTTLNLRSNKLEGPIPKFPINMRVVDLSNNSLSGPLPLDFPSFYYDLSYNKIQGRMPLSICNSTQLLFLDLSHNQIFGEIPHCKLCDLRVIRLGYNNLIGEIPSSIGQLKYITSLHLNNNNLYGRIPSSLRNCSELQVLDLSNNKLSGSIPTWIGQSLQQLIILQLRSNMFSGDISLHIGQLSYLQIIDLANNHLTGSIPHSLGNCSALVLTSKITSQGLFGFSVGTTGVIVGRSSITIVTKGYEYSYSKILFLVKSIDLSNNNLVGEIPEEFGFLEGLQILNLSRNHLIGNIPNTIGGMKSLETLDLSYNVLSGVIPQGLSALNSLDYLNLSYNNFSGMIPQGNQLQTLQDASIYEGNVYLCGAVINKSCPGDKNATAIDEEHEDSSKMLPKYLGITLGFLSGLWSVLVILLFKRDWRSFYFLMIDKIYDKVYVSIKIRQNKWVMS